MSIIKVKKEIKSSRKLSCRYSIFFVNVLFEDKCKFNQNFSLLIWLIPLLYMSDSSKENLCLWHYIEEHLTSPFFLFLSISLFLFLLVLQSRKKSIISHLALLHFTSGYNNAEFYYILKQNEKNKNKDHWRQITELLLISYTINIFSSFIFREQKKTSEMLKHLIILLSFLQLIHCLSTRSNSKL